MTFTAPRLSLLEIRMSGRIHKSSGSWALLELYRLVTKRVSLHAFFTLLHGEDIAMNFVDEGSGSLYTRALPGSGSQAYHIVGLQLTDCAQEVLILN